MKYFLDTEFIEGFHKPWFGKRRHHIDLISIALVGEDGSSFYAISNEYEYKDASDWVKDNVILPLYKETVHGDARNHFDVHNFHKHFGKSNKEIMVDLLLYIYRDTYKHWMDDTAEFIHRAIKFGWLQPNDSRIEFYAYYADYDWVLFCSLFGKMIDLPYNFPRYCRDLKQMLDDKAAALPLRIGDPYQTPKWVLPLKDKLDYIKKRPEFPTQENEHSALDDARWNLALYNFIQTFFSDDKN